MICWLCWMDTTVYIMMYINNILLACTEYCTECCTACYLHVYMQPSHMSTFSPCSCAPSLCYYFLHHLLSLSCAHGNQCPVCHVHLGWKHLSTLPTLAQTFCGPFRTSSLCWYVQWCFIYRPHKINFLFWFAYVIRCNVQYSACNHSVYTTCTQCKKKERATCRTRNRKILLYAHSLVSENACERFYFIYRVCWCEWGK